MPMLEVGDVVRTLMDGGRWDTPMPAGTRGTVVGVCSEGCCVELAIDLVAPHISLYDTNYVEKVYVCMFGGET